MATSFVSLPIVDLSCLSNPSLSADSLSRLGQQLCDVFATTGFAYLVNAPLSFSHDDVFDLARDYFRMPAAEKTRLATQQAVASNHNTYRGYFPPQPGRPSNFKEGFEVGPPGGTRATALSRQQTHDLAEPNVWPHESAFPGGRQRVERLHRELQTLASTLLSLVATGLGRPGDYFRPYLDGSLSTLRLLHYPPAHHDHDHNDNDDDDDDDPDRLCCTPHTDSGILTLLHQDETGGLEVQNADGAWVPAPYVPGSMVVNIGDLMAHVSGGRFVATMHRVRAPRDGGGAATARPDGMGRFSVPFFFEPGEACVVRSVDGHEAVLYGEYLRKKMGTWVEYQDQDAAGSTLDAVPSDVVVEAY